MTHGIGNIAQDIPKLELGNERERDSVYFLNRVLERFSNNIKGVKMGWIEDEFTRDAFTTEGNITCGWKDEKGNLHRAEHFVVNRFPRITKIYGDKPKSLFIEFPVQGKIQEVVSLEMVEWGQAGMVRKCNKREQQVFRDEIVDVVDGKRIAREKFGKYACQSPNCKCKASADLICHILHPDTGTAITGLMRIHNGSIRSVNNIKTMLKNVMSYGETEEEQEKMPRCFVWEISVVMRKAKVGKTPTLEIKPVGFKQTRSANNLLKAAGLDAESGGMLMIGEKSDSELGMQNDELKTGRSQAGACGTREGDYTEESKAGMTKSGEITQEDLYAGLKGDVVDAKFEEIEEDEPEVPKRMDGFGIIQRLHTCETREEYYQILLDFNELNGRNEIGLVDLRTIREMMKEWESNSELGMQNDELKSEKHFTTERTEDTEGNSGKEQEQEFLTKLVGPVTQEVWVKLLEEFNGMQIPVVRKMELKEKLFKIKP